MGTARFGNLRFTWAKLPSLMGAEVKAKGDKLDPALLSEMTSIAARMESYAKSNAPWNDRTGDARRSLECRAQFTAAHNVSCIIRHNVPYGGFLETGTSRMSPRPILGPTLQAHYGEVRAAMNKLAGLNF